VTAVGRSSAFGPGHSGEALSALLDGELDEREAEAVGRHLAGCLACCLEMARLSDARRRLRSMATVAAPSELTERTRARIGWQRRAVALAAVLGSAGAGLVLWAARPEAEVSAIPASAYSLVQSSVYAAAGVSAPTLRPGGLSPAVTTTAMTVSVSRSTGPATLAPTPVRLSSQPLLLGSLPAGYLAPAVIDGMALTGVWHRGAVLAAVYGQGASRLFMIEQAGRLVASSGQSWTVLGSMRGQAGTWGSQATFAGQVGPDLVVTAVGSGQDVAEAADSMGTWRVNPPWLYRTRTLARRLVEELTGS
jgi:anti-sigma factor RsiW